MNLKGWEAIISQIVDAIGQDPRESGTQKILIAWRAKLEKGPTFLEPYQIDEIVREVRKRLTKGTLPHESHASWIARRIAGSTHSEKSGPIHHGEAVRPRDEATKDERSSSMRALTIPQPHAEAIIRGKKLVDYRPAATTVRGRIYIYASLERLASEDEAAWLGEYDINDMSSDELPRGVIVGTVELSDCTDNGRVFSWHFMNPERATELLVPKNKPMGMWFTPF